MAFHIGGQTVAEGDAQWVDIPVTTDADGAEHSIDLHVIHGDPGPVLWLQGCLHGPEQVGPYAIRSFLDRLDPSSVDGTIIGVPVVNKTAFANKQRESPIDGKDLNRNFPGSEDGSFTDQLAATLYSTVSEHADYVVDMHTGGNEFNIPGYSIFPKTGTELEETTRELCEVADLPYAVGIPGGSLGGAMYAELADEGIPAVITETGGEGRLHDGVVADAVRALQNIARELELVTGEIDRTTEVSVHEGLDIVQSQAGGFFEAEVTGNDEVPEGTTLAQITNLQGDVVDTFEAPYDAVVVAVRTYSIARPGDWVFELVPQ